MSAVVMTLFCWHRLHELCQDAPRSMRDDCQCECHEEEET